MAGVSVSTTAGRGMSPSTPRLDAAAHLDLLRYGTAAVTEEALILEKELAAANDLIAKTRKEDWEDRPDQYSVDIEKAVPCCGNHTPADFKRYERALDMVHNRNGKYELVDLVNWLLARAEKAEAK